MSFMADRTVATFEENGSCELLAVCLLYSSDEQSELGFVQICRFLRLHLADCSSVSIV